MSGSTPHLRGFALVVCGTLLLSPDGLLFRMVQAGEWQIVFWRGMFGFLALAAFLTAARPGGFVGGLRRSGWPGLLCAVLMTAGTVMFVAAITRTTVANTLLVLSVVPLAAAILGLAILGERVPRRTWLTIAAALVGMVIIFSGSVGGALLGDALAAGTALCIAGSLVVIRANPRVSMLPALAASGLIAAVVGAFVGDPGDITWRDVGLTAIMGTVMQAVAVGMFLAGARYLPPAEVGLVGLIETVLGPLWVLIVIGEEPATAALVGGALVLLALAANFIAALRRQARRAPTATARVGGELPPG